MESLFHVGLGFPASFRRILAIVLANVLVCGMECSGALTLGGLRLAGCCQDVLQ